MGSAAGLTSRPMSGRRRHAVRKHHIPPELKAECGAADMPMRNYGSLHAPGARGEIDWSTMYSDFFGFRELPFNNTPDPRFFFATPDHEEGLASLIYAVKERKGFVLLTGEVGTGKTLVTRMMLRHFGTQLSFANISHGIENPVELMESICTEFELECEPGASTTQLIRSLHDFLLGQFAQDIPVVLVLDEAQNLPVQAFEQLRMIGNLEADDAKLLQIAIVGQPELQRRFLSPKLRQLRQRIFRSYHLPALNREMTDQYIRHRLSVVSDGDAEVFSTDAVSEIFNVSQGLPRIINTTCDNALLSAYSVGKQHVDGAFIESVVSQMMILGEPSQELRHAPLQSSSRGGVGRPRIEAPSQDLAGETFPGSPASAASPQGAVGAAPRPPIASPTASAVPPVEDSTVLREQPASIQREAIAPVSASVHSEVADLNETLNRHKREASSQAMRTEQLVAAVSKECGKAQGLHASLAAMVQTAADVTARAEAASRTIEHRDAQLRKVSATVSELVRNLRSLLDRARETTADVVTVERGARKTYGRLSDQINGAGRIAEALNQLSDRQSMQPGRIIPATRQTLPEQTRSDSALLGPPSRRVSGTVNEDAAQTKDASIKQDTATPAEELLRNARASLSDLRTLAGTGRPTGYVPPPNVGRKAESATRLANQVEDILEMIDPTDEAGLSTDEAGLLTDEADSSTASIMPEEFAEIGN